MLPVKIALNNLWKKISLRSSLIIIAIVLLVGGIWSLNLENSFGDQINRLEYPLLDLRHQWYANRTELSDEVVLVVITENSLQTFRDNLGRWPWPRRIWAAVIDYLRQADQIKFDIGFWEPSLVELTPRLIDQLRNQLNQAKQLQSTDRAEANKVLERLNRQLGDLQTPDDQLLGKFTGQAGNVVHAITFRELTDRLSEPPELTEQQKIFYETYGWKLTGKVRGTTTGDLVIPIDPLLSTSAFFSHIHFIPDPDGVARRFAPFVESSNYQGKTRFFPLLGMTGSLASEKRQTSYQTNQLRSNGVTVPLDRQGYIPIRYRGDISEYTVIPVEQLVEPMIRGTQPAIPSEWFAGKTVLIGATAPGLFDLNPTPLDPVQPGMLVHATVHEMLATGDLLYPENTTVTWLTIIASGIIIGLVALFTGPFSGLLLMAIIFGGFIYGSFWGFDQGYTINLSLPIITGILVFGGVTAENLLKEKQQRRWIKNVFQHYLPRTLLKTLLAEPEKLQLKARRQTVTMLFIDIANFTSLSEKLKATDLTQRLNEILSEMSSCVFQYEGIIDKFIGDAMMAEFGLLDLEPPEQERRACQAANEMIKRLKIFNQNNPDNNLQVRIGINTGTVAAGNMGSRELFDYTVIGDAVNLAARLEGVNKIYKTSCIIGEQTRQGLGADAIVRELDTVQVKGRQQPVKIYEWIGWANSVPEGKLELINNYEKALEKYRKREFAAALQIVPGPETGDSPSDYLRIRCQDLLENPPAEDWKPFTALHQK